MKFLADENLERAVVEALRRGGHDVAYVAEGGGSPSDDEVLERARRERRILLYEPASSGTRLILDGVYFVARGRVFGSDKVDARAQNVHEPGKRGLTEVLTSSTRR